ncbi:uncharacterized protein LOC114518823 [Dendronephthya gigantea]|uniref:uncharacterized protein LOC114518823 n=1 Tax=Dendronephthya gigantea TaxID=151771 RepID=UPI001069F266|nr:uncharacterized protein LOC114518823 [Dendronephthya gigantea]XP_028394621.1 uncharacterized protein LOC114518823 [Dendronephthya gigantea]
MIWPKNSKPADQRWDVFFEPVMNNTENAIPQKYVVVVFVAQCRGGVFTEEPECYDIINNKVHKIDYSSWVQRIDPCLALKEGTYPANTPSDLVYEELTYHLNKGEELDVLDAAIKNARENYKNGGDVDLICLSKFISFYLRRGEYSLVEEYFIKYTKKLTSVSSSSKVEVMGRFEVMEQYLRCVQERCKGNYEESYEIAKQCSHNLKKLPYCIISAAFYVQIATLENILAMKTEDNEKRLALRSQAEKNYVLASSHLKQIQGHRTTKAEYLQKIYINSALLQLACSLTGDVLQDSEELVDTEKAKKFLRQAYDITLDSYPISKFRKIQSLFAEACLSYRLGREDPSRQNETLKHALNYSKEAKNLAEKCTFVEMKKYAENFIKFFEQSEESQI